MQWNKIKTILILILLTANLILGGSIAMHAVEQEMIRRGSAENTQTILQGRNISCAEAVFAQKSYLLASVRIALDTQQLRQFADCFLQEGTWEEKQDGEQITRIDNMGNTISFDGNGIFSGTLKEELPLSLEEAQSKADHWMKNQSSEYQLEGEEIGGNYTVKAYRLIQGVPLEEPMQFLFLLDGTVSLSGRWTFGTATVTETKQDCRDTLAGSLLRFVDTVNVQEIQQAKPCFCLISDSSKSLLAEPGWRLNTDQGEYLTSARSDYVIFREKTEKN